ncbi:MAG: FAD-dependent oxidoreductase [Phycisphaerae bacterium]
MPNQPKETITIIGAGLGGALMACYFAKAGYPVEVFERRPDPRSGKIVGGRSINLALSQRGLHALREVGLAEPVLKLAIPMPGRMIHSPSGQLSYQPYDKDPDRAILSVSRGGLNQLLVETAEALPNVTVRFGQRCIDVDLDAPRATLEDIDSHELTQTTGRIIIGADGAFSAVRSRLQREDRFDYQQQYLEHGYKELHIPAADAGGFRIEPNALHIWPRESYMMIALPNPDGSFTCTCFWPFRGPHGFEQLQTPEQIRAYFEKHFADAVPHMPTLVEDFQQNPTSSLVTVRCGPWNYRDKVVLLGDAAHAVVPFYGQGMNCAFEDCTILNECVAQHAPDWGKVFAAYYGERKPNADALANLALYNFIEMRDHSGSRLFRWKKSFERFVDRITGKWYTPLYTMISFTRTPYAAAVRRAARQDRAVFNVAIAFITLLFIIVMWLIFRTQGA